jgi:hypothetical protein
MNKLFLKIQYCREHRKNINKSVCFAPHSYPMMLQRLFIRLLLTIGIELIIKCISQVQLVRSLPLLILTFLTNIL